MEAVQPLRLKQLSTHRYRELSVVFGERAGAGTQRSGEWGVALQYMPGRLVLPLPGGVVGSVPPLSFPLEPTLHQCQDLPNCPSLPLGPKHF